MPELILAASFGPALSGPRQIVIHSVESEITAGLAESLARGHFRDPSHQTSAHTIADQTAEIQLVPYDQRAWHCGNGNSTSIGKEHCGRAAFSLEQWTTPDGLAMLRRSARESALICKRFDIPPRWLSVVQVANNDRGFCTHNDMRLGRGGTTHTDPGPNFPYDTYLQLVREELGTATTDGDDDMDEATFNMMWDKRADAQLGKSAVANPGALLNTGGILDRVAANLPGMLKKKLTK